MLQATCHAHAFLSVSLSKTPLSFFASCICRKPINLNGKSVNYKSWLKSISFVVNTFPLCCGFENITHTDTDRQTDRWADWVRGGQTHSHAGKTVALVVLAQLQAQRVTVAGTFVNQNRQREGETEKQRGRAHCKSRIPLAFCSLPLPLSLSVSLLLDCGHDWTCSARSTGHMWLLYIFLACPFAKSFTHSHNHTHTLPNWALSQYPSQRSKVVVVVLVLVHVIPALPARQAVSQYICSLLVVHRFRQLILLESSTHTHTYVHCAALLRSLLSHVCG